MQLLLGAGLLVWASQGFPLPGGESPAAAGRDAGRAAGPRAIAPRSRVAAFDGDRAFALLREQVQRYGPRPAGSRASRHLAERLRRLLPNGRFEAVGGGLRNVVGTLPGRRPAVVIGAHYDTEATIPGHVGANDGAAGTAGVVQLARELRRRPRRAGAPELRFVLFDGEEEPRGSDDFLRDGLRGSKAYVARHGDEVRALILLDYVAEARGPRFPREASSDRRLWERLRAAARRVGVGALFPAAKGDTIVDDHTPFLARGIPAIDIIDFDYPERDSLADDLDAVGARTLDAVGEAVLELVRSSYTG